MRELGVLGLVRVAPLLVRNASTCWSITVLRKNASTVGAGPLIVIDTLVDGETRSKPSYSAFMSSSVDRHAEVPATP